jgi:hypothetical protein
VTLRKIVMVRAATAHGKPKRDLGASRYEVEDGEFMGSSLWVMRAAFQRPGTAQACPVGPARGTAGMTCHGDAA